MQNNQDYEQKKRECWAEFCRMNPSHNRSIFLKKTLEFAFDRAYALGKQKETISHEEIEDAAKDYAYDIDGSDWERQRTRDGFVDGANFALGKQEKDADTDKTIKINKQTFCYLCAEADDYINEHLEEEDSDYAYYQGRSDALHELYRGECKDAEETVIQGWVARDKDRCLTLFIGKEKPYKKKGCNFWCVDYDRPLETLPITLFPDITWESEPEQVEIILKRKKNAI